MGQFLQCTGSAGKRFRAPELLDPDAPAGRGNERFGRRHPDPGPEHHPPARLGSVTIARIEIAWLAGTNDDLAGRSEPVLDLAAATANLAIQAELSRYLQRAGFAPVQVTAAPEPWAAGLRGDWREAARLWAVRAEPYEQALELVAGDDPTAVAAGRDLLRSLGATRTLIAVSRRRT
jgi:hypothetical protein